VLRVGLGGVRRGVGYLCALQLSKGPWERCVAGGWRGRQRCLRGSEVGGENIGHKGIKEKRLTKHEKKKKASVAG